MDFEHDTQTEADIVSKIGTTTTKILSLLMCMSKHDRDRWLRAVALYEICDSVCKREGSEVFAAIHEHPMLAEFFAQSAGQG